MSSRLEWTYNTCLGCDALTDDNNAMEKVHDLSLSSMRLTETSSTASPRKTISAKAEQQLRMYNVSLDQSKMQRSASR
ncbi:hypothetical protein V8C42DRAFT_338444 [Trichoderma barbatum]